MDIWIDHKIITFPHQNLIQFQDIHNVQHSIKYPLNPPKDYYVSHVSRVEKTTIIYPGDCFFYQLPPKFSTVKRVAFAPRLSLQNQGFLPTQCSVQPNLKIKISNDTSQCYLGLINFRRHKNRLEIIYEYF